VGNGIGVKVGKSGMRDVSVGTKVTGVGVKVTGVGVTVAKRSRVGIRVTVG